MLAKYISKAGGGETTSTSVALTIYDVVAYLSCIWWPFVVEILNGKKLWLGFGQIAGVKPTWSRWRLVNVVFLVGISGWNEAVGAVRSLLCVNRNVRDRATSPLLLLDAYITPKGFKDSVVVRKARERLSWSQKSSFRVSERRVHKGIEISLRKIITEASTNCLKKWESSGTKFLVFKTKF